MLTRGETAEGLFFGPETFEYEAFSWCIRVEETFVTLFMFSIFMRS